MSQQPPINKPIEVLVTLPLAEGLIDRLSAVSARLNITTINARDAQEIPAEVWAATEVLYTSRALPTPEQAPRLRWIQLRHGGGSRPHPRDP